MRSMERSGLRFAFILLISLIVVGIVNSQVQSPSGDGDWMLQDLSDSLTGVSESLPLAGIHFAIGTAAAWSTDIETVSLPVGLLVVTGTVVVEKRAERISKLRDRIIQEIECQPGIHLRELRRVVGCAVGAIQYHIRLMEDDGVIVSLRIGNTRHLFPSSFSNNTELMKITALLRNPSILGIIERCMSSGRITQAELSRELKMDKSLISYYVSLLVEMGVLKTVPVFGRERPLTLTESAHSVLASLACFLPSGGC
ncbi:MAG: winged helix-turn-helix transcriptional regulator [Candidatus Thorarchaeota archaeon]